MEDRRTARIAARVERDIGSPGLVARLAELAWSEVQPLLLELWRERAGRTSVSDLATASARPLFVASSSDAQLLHRFDAMALAAASEGLEPDASLRRAEAQPLHGTNSHDRRQGAEGVLRGLLEGGAIGICTTHDLALAGIVDAIGGRCANAHFGDVLENGKLHFDYKLRPGVVRQSNAIELMRAVGLRV